jgi:hypothetical protein
VAHQEALRIPEDEMPQRGSIIGAFSAKIISEEIK